MAEKNNYSSEGLDLFTIMVAGLLKQASNLINNLDDYVSEDEDIEEKKEYEAPKCTVTEVDKTKETGLKYPKFQYQLCEDPDKGEEKWTDINDDSPIDKRIKEVLDRLIFKIRINYEGKVEYDVELLFGEVKAKFNWNIEHDRFEGVIYTGDGKSDGSDCVEVFYCETEDKFYPMNDSCDAVCDCETECCEEDINECCDCEEAEENENPKNEDCTIKEDYDSIKFDACSSNPCRSHIKCEEIEDKTTTADRLYHRLNADKQNVINRCLNEVKTAFNRIIDYKTYDTHMNEKGIINEISFAYNTIQGLFKNTELNADFEEINPEVVLNFIKETFGFKDVTMDCDDVVYCTLK